MCFFLNAAGAEIRREFAAPASARTAADDRTVQVEPPLQRRPVSGAARRSPRVEGVRHNGKTERGGGVIQPFAGCGERCRGRGGSEAPRRIAIGRQPLLCNDNPQFVGNRGNGAAWLKRRQARRLRRGESAAVEDGIELPDTRPVEKRHGSVQHEKCGQERKRGRDARPYAVAPPFALPPAGRHLQPYPGAALSGLNAPPNIVCPAFAQPAMNRGMMRMRILFLQAVCIDGAKIFRLRNAAGRE